LLCAAKWTNRWFNKPKFHIFLHLPTHIRRFGPAILFATEAFESFNVVIRAKSVHSNRHAPSRDIALAFAQGNRIRHLLSGGLFVLNTPALEISLDPAERLELQPANFIFSRNRPSWKTIGEGPKSLVSGRSTVTHYLGLDGKKKLTPGIFFRATSTQNVLIFCVKGSVSPTNLQRGQLPARLQANAYLHGQQKLGFSRPTSSCTSAMGTHAHHKVL
jgi:hypothetical protein